MSYILSMIDCEMQKKLLEFVKNEKSNKNKKPLSECLIVEILEQICNKERTITGMVTDYKNGDIFVRFSFTKEV